MASLHRNFGCDPANPNAIGENDKIYRKIPNHTKAMQVQVTCYDGTKSPVRTVKVKFWSFVLRRGFAALHSL